MRNHILMALMIAFAACSDVKNRDEFPMMPPDDAQLDVVENGIALSELITNKSGKFVPLVLEDPLMYADFQNLVIGRVAIPRIMPSWFVGTMPATFVVGDVNTDGSSVTKNFFAMVDCNVDRQDQEHPLWVLDPVSGQWSRAFNSFVNYNLAVAHQACWMAYPTRISVQHIIDPD